RVAIARALASNPEVILCDEATSALDPKTTAQILELLKKINKELGVTIVIITHQMSVIESICDEVAILHKSEVAEKGLVEDVFKSPKSEIGKKLIFSDKNQDDKEDIPVNDDYKCLRIVYNGKDTNEPILSNLILKYNEPISMLYGDIKELNGKVFGHMVIGIDKNSTHINDIKKYLEEKNITVKEMN
ncbi:MAG: methionine ABC transporter ATP-binding protein, partial [Lachnospiraceae bacterium]|nr:methionine ABC transporter ATP-binding protein [Lachnospiraceae bacterium]